MGKIIKVREVGDPVLNKMSEEVDITNINNDYSVKRIYKQNFNIVSVKCAVVKPI